jgi:hypothetical protein
MKVLFLSLLVLAQQNAFGKRLNFPNLVKIVGLVFKPTLLALRDDVKGFKSNRFGAN